MVVLVSSYILNLQSGVYGIPLFFEKLLYTPYSQLCTLI